MMTRAKDNNQLFCPVYNKTVYTYRHWKVPYQHQNMHGNSVASIDMFYADLYCVIVMSVECQQWYPSWQTT